jgi:hypothetical protein
MSGFFADAVRFVACLVCAACVGSLGAAILIEISNRRK